MMANPLVNMTAERSLSSMSSSSRPSCSSSISGCLNTKRTEQGAEESSNPLLQCVLADLERAEREGDRSRTIEASNALGLIRLHTQRDSAEALKCHQRALALCSEAMETSITCMDMGLCYERLGEEQEALKSYERAYELLEDSVSESHPRRVGLKRVLARLSRK